MSHALLRPALNTAAIVGALTAALTSGACATATPVTVAHDQRGESAEFTQDQREEKAAFERKQQDQRAGLVADQAQELANVEMSNQADQTTFVIKSRERVAKFDARVAELRKLGKIVDEATVQARADVIAHIERSDDAPTTYAAWLIDRDAVNDELTALGNQIERSTK